MKRELFLFVAIAICTPVFSQGDLFRKAETGNSKIKWGIKAGLALAKLKIEYNPATVVYSNDITSKLGAMGGGFVQLQLSQTLCFQPELLMVGKGMKEKNQNYAYKNNLTYLELPFNLLYKPSASKGSFFIGGGPAPALYIGENVFYSGYDNFKEFDFGINILTGYELPIGFSINLHYTYGLLNISQNKTDVPVTRNRCFGLCVGYTF